MKSKKKKKDNGNSPPVPPLPLSHEFKEKGENIVKGKKKIKEKNR